MSQTPNTAIAVIGIDIGKNSFHVVGHNRRGAIVLRQKWSRGQIEARLALVRAVAALRIKPGDAEKPAASRGDCEFRDDAPGSDLADLVALGHRVHRRHSNIRLGAQNMSEHNVGAYTGENSGLGIPIYNGLATDAHPIAVLVDYYFAHLLSLLTLRIFNDGDGVPFRRPFFSTVFAADGVAVTAEDRSAGGRRGRGRDLGEDEAQAVRDHTAVADAEDGRGVRQPPRDRRAFGASYPVCGNGRGRGRESGRGDGRRVDAARVRGRDAGRTRG